MPHNHISTVTMHGSEKIAVWNVGATISNGEYRLSLFRILPSGRFFSHPIYDDMLIAEEDAEQWKLTHGFIQPFYRREWCPVCRKLHKFCHKYTGPCAVASGYAYDGCVEAQESFDAEDVTYSPVSCHCGKRHWIPSYLLSLPNGSAPFHRCHECRWKQAFPPKWKETIDDQEAALIANLTDQ